MTSAFDGFVSYRRSDGSEFAKRLRKRLQEFRLPKSLNGKSAQPLKIYIDTIYEQATNDFFESVTLPALLSSRYLIVVATPDAADRGPERNDWIRREIEAFESGPNAGKTFVVRAKGELGDRLPGDLEQRYPNMEIIDLRGLGPFAFLNPPKAATLADETVKLLAPLLGFGVEEMPMLRREEERRQQVRLGLAAGAATAVIIAVGGLAILAFVSRSRALDALSRSQFATDRVIQSVSGSLAEGDARSRLLASSCDLLDSLRDQSPTPPRTNSLVLCAIERADSRDRLGESSKAAELIESAVALAESQFAKQGSADDALAVLQARRAKLDRAIAKGPPGSEHNALDEFISSSSNYTKSLVLEPGVPEFAAQALQVATVSLAENRKLNDALTAAEAAIDLRQEALKRGADLSTRLDHVATISLKSEVLRLLGETCLSSEIAAQAKLLLSQVSSKDIEREGLAVRYREVSELTSRGDARVKP